MRSHRAAAAERPALRCRGSWQQSQATSLMVAMLKVFVSLLSPLSCRQVKGSQPEVVPSLSGNATSSCLSLREREDLWWDVKQLGLGAGVGLHVSSGCSLFHNISWKLLAQGSGRD